MDMESTKKKMNSNDNEESTLDALSHSYFIMLFDVWCWLLMWKKLKFNFLPTEYTTTTTTTTTSTIINKPEQKIVFPCSRAHVFIYSICSVERSLFRFFSYILHISSKPAIFHFLFHWPIGIMDFHLPYHLLLYSMG